MMRTTARRLAFAIASLAFITLASALILATSARAQGTLEDYQRAEKFLPGNARHLYTTGDIMPHWIEKSDRFWYRKPTLKGPEINYEFILVDAAQNTSNPAFDHARLAEALSRATKQNQDPAKLPFDYFDFIDNGSHSLRASRHAVDLQSR